MDPLNTLSPTINFSNYQTYNFALPCGRLAADFPTDQFVFFQSTDDFNFIVPIEAYETTPHGSGYYSGPLGSVVNDQRFVSWMVPSLATDECHQVQEVVGEDRQ